MVAGPLTNSATGVTNGLFTVTLDFGPGVFTGPGRWLEVDVRTNGNGAFTTLLPFQQLLPVPYAMTANTASNLLGMLPAAQLTGTLPSSVLAGYSGTVTLTNGGNSFNGSFSGSFGGNGAGLSNASPNIATNNATATDGMVLVKSGDNLDWEMIGSGGVSYTVANLSAASTGTQVWCSDMLTPWGTGGMVYYDGVVWRDVTTRIRATTSVPQLLLNAYSIGYIAHTPSLVAEIADDWFAVPPWFVESGTVWSSGGSELNALRLNDSAGGSSYGMVQSTSYSVQSTSDFLLMGTCCSMLADAAAGESVYWLFGYLKGGPSMPSDVACFVYDKNKVSPVASQITGAATNHWQCVTATSGTYAVVDSGLTPTFGGSFQQLAVLVNPGVSAVFYTNGVACATNTSDLPTGYLNPTASIFSPAGTATTRSVDLQWFYNAKYWGTARNFR